MPAKARGKSRRRSTPPRFAGIDPGKEGVITVLNEKGGILTQWWIPYLGDRINYPQLGRMFAAMKRCGVRLIFLEEQHAFHKEGPKGAFTNGAGYGALCAMLAVVGIPYEIVKPEDWKRSAKIPVPSVPKAKLPPKPATKAKLKAWEKKVKRIKDKRSREVKKRRKELSIARAQALQPGYDFRRSTRARVPHDGKCESYLLAREAWKQARRMT